MSNQNPDPFHFNQIKPASGPPAPRSQPSPEDLLFEGAEAAAAAGTSGAQWDGGSSTAHGLSSGGRDEVDFGSDILGEKDKAGAVRPLPRPKPKLGGAFPGTQPSRSPSAPRSGQPGLAARTSPPVPVSPASGAPAAASASAPARPASPPASAPGKPVMPMFLVGRRHRVGLRVPLALIVVGSGAASWFYLIGHSTILAALSGAAAVVGSAFAWVWQRR